MWIVIVQLGSSPPPLFAAQMTSPITAIAPIAITAPSVDPTSVDFGVVDLPAEDV